MNSNPKGQKANAENPQTAEKPARARAWTETGAEHAIDPDAYSIPFVVNDAGGDCRALLEAAACGNIHGFIENADRALTALDVLEAVRAQWPYMVRVGGHAGDDPASRFVLTHHWSDVVLSLNDYVRMNLRKIAMAIPGENQFPDDEVEGA